MTHRGPSPSTRGLNARQPLPVAGGWLFGGAVAAGLGLGALAVLVLLLWIVSPYPDSGADGALHLAADLWLLAHGVELVRVETLSGVPAPLGVTPLLLTALPVWLLHRATREGLGEAGVLSEEDGEDGEGGGDGEDAGEESAGEPASSATAVAAAAWVTVGYLLVGAAAVVYTCGGPVQVDVVSAAWHLPLFAVAVAGISVWTALGRPLPEALSERGGERVEERAEVSVHAGLAGVVALWGGGAVLLTGAVVWHLGAVQSSFPQLTSSVSGRFSVLLLAVVLAPNAAVWALTYGLGPGFSLGGASELGPFAGGGATAPHLPPFPLLAAVPDDGATGPLLWCLAGAVPVLGGAACAWGVGRTRAALGETAVRALLAAAFCGLAVALLAALAGGALGVGTLADFGPVWWEACGAAFAWCAGVGVPGALLVRWWYGRQLARPTRAERRRIRAAAKAAKITARETRATRTGKAEKKAGTEAEPGPKPETAKTKRKSKTKRKAKASAEAAAGTPGAARESVSAAPSAPYDGETDEWHDDEARRMRWSAMKEASGGLMPDFEPRDPH
ncbi:DUF6350 family protein [Streptomyces sp. NPDC048172]|uniref:cell division protein PerM n=1 Tax=Streptomyces sp. NPDC048172 TaxID=3365505 RepID=UPI003713B76F